ncbi:MAG TPA: (Fe-S)-binding protein [Candidatus Dormibacteraeota bacterium]|nr:(Fe-S)-binding protein [Candidatus Dormibacteraeota bacterium]
MTELADPPRQESGATASPAPAAPVSRVRPRFLADVYEEASRCNKCSLCQATCPAYQVNPVEWETARGRVSLIRDAIEGRLDLRDLADGPLSTCLTCNNCVAACAPAVDTAQIVARARQELHEQEGHSWARTIGLRMLASPAGLGTIRTMARIGRATRLQTLVRGTGLTRWMGLPGAVIDQVDPAGGPGGSTAQRVVPAVGERRGRLGFLTCCYQGLTAPQVTEATLRVLAANGFEVVVPSLGCSGLPAKTLGDRDALLTMGRRTVERVRDLDVDALVGDAASCTQHVRDYGRQLAPARELAPAAGRVASRTWQASSWLASRGLTAPLGRLRWTVAVDEPCALPHAGPERAALHRLLEAVPGLRVVELEEAAMCCGGAGTYFHSQADRSAAILARKMRHVVASGAEVVVTENVSCLHQLREGARLHAPHVRVLHVFEVLAAAIDVAERRRELAERR